VVGHCGSAARSTDKAPAAPPEAPAAAVPASAPHGSEAAQRELAQEADRRTPKGFRNPTGEIAAAPEKAAPRSTSHRHAARPSSTRTAALSGATSNSALAPAMPLRLRCRPIPLHCRPAGEPPGASCCDSAECQPDPLARLARGGSGAACFGCARAGAAHRSRLLPRYRLSGSLGLLHLEQGAHVHSGQVAAAPRGHRRSRHQMVLGFGSLGLRKHHGQAEVAASQLDRCGHRFLDASTERPCRHPALLRFVRHPARRRQSAPGRPAGGGGLGKQSGVCLRGRRWPARRCRGGPGWAAERGP